MNSIYKTEEVDESNYWNWNGFKIFWSVKGKENTLFSLMAMPEARVSITGARWDLQHEQLKMSGRGIHNEIGSSCEVTIECHSGNLLVIQGNFVLPHD